MQPLFEHRLELAGYETRALELEGEGPPLLLLHGFSDSADTWRPLLAKLGARDRRALAVDLPGFAAAAPVRAGPVLPQFDAFASAAVDHLGEAGEVVVCGNSLGGVVALRLGEGRGLPLAGVVPVAPAGLDMPVWFQIIERDPVVRTLLALPFPIPQRVMRTAVGEVYRRLVFAGPGGPDTRRMVEAFTFHHRSPAAVARYLETGRRLLPELADPFRFDRVDVPVLLVWGDRDRMVPHRGAQRVLEALPDTRVELLPGIGHCPQLEAVDRLAELLHDFPAPARRAA